MSFRSDNDNQTEQKVADEMEALEMSAFERHIINCCKEPEWSLRNWLRRVLTKAGFTWKEDGYRTDRVALDARYGSVHNALAIRGDNPKICLVAHTDVCRDHEDSRYSMLGDFGWLRDEEEPKPAAAVKRQISDKKVEPVIKVIEHEGQMRRIIQDKNCSIQIGGDDRLGVAIITWIALNTGYPVALYFPTDEEIGLKSAAACEMEELKSFDLLCEVDKGNASNLVVVKIGGNVICSYDMACFLLETAFDIGLPREPGTGLGTDIAVLHRRGFAKNAINLTCGYHNSRGAQKDEYIEVSEARDTLKYVGNIVRRFYLGEAPQ